MDRFIKYKKYLPSALYILGSFILLLSLFTQIPNLFSNISIAGNIKEGLSEKKQSLESVRNASSQQISSQLALASKALPGEKDATLIFASITDTASKNAIDIQSFNIEVGDVFVANGERDTSIQELTVQIDILSPSHVNTQQFVAGLYHSLPLSEIVDMRVTEGEGKIVMKFFYKGEREVASESAVSPLSASQREVLNTIAGWGR